MAVERVGSGIEEFSSDSFDGTGTWAVEWAAVRWRLKEAAVEWAAVEWTAVGW
jgi:hypothetical protein